MKARALTLLYDGWTVDRRVLFHDPLAFCRQLSSPLLLSRFKLLHGAFPKTASDEAVIYMCDCAIWQCGQVLTCLFLPFCGSFAVQHVVNKLSAGLGRSDNHKPFLAESGTGNKRSSSISWAVGQWGLGWAGGPQKLSVASLSV